MKSRPYQSEFTKSVAQGFAEGFKRQLGVLPTGGGKTLCFAFQAERFHRKRNEKTLVLAHREELVKQAADKILRATGLKSEIEKAGDRASLDAGVVVASIQTMQGKRLERWPKDHFGLVVCDEAHHVLASQWQATLAHFEPARVLGVTATPDRGDKKNLAQYFERIAYECTILDLIAQGFLVPTFVQAAPLKIDLSAVSSRAGDFSDTDLGSAIEPYLDGIADYLIANLRDRKIICFLPLVQTSKRFTDILKSKGMTACHIDGQSPDRSDILADYHNGKYQVLCNAMLLTEGYDEPTVDCVVVLRPTRSRPLYAQMIGRGTRILDGTIDGLETIEERKQAIAASAKKNLIVLDFLWLHARHDLARPASLVAKTKTQEEAVTDILLNGEAAKDLAEALEDAIAEREAALASELAKNSLKSSRFISIDAIAGMVKDSTISDYEPIFKWEKDRPTGAQIKVLERFKIAPPATRGQASMVMDRLFDRSKKKLATVGQLKYLIQFRHPHPETATFEEASKFLDSKFAKRG
jgi:superfamily II DNA or RNA helicase